MASKSARIHPDDPTEYIFDIQTTGKKIFLGTMWELPSGLWRWESYWGDNKNIEPNAEAAITMLETVARDMARAGTISMEDAV
jgi:hypothetical protein